MEVAGDNASSGPRAREQIFTTFEADGTSIAYLSV